MDGRFVALAAALSLTSAAFGQAAQTPLPSRFQGIEAQFDDLFFMHMQTDGDWVSDVVIPPGRQYRGCTNTSSHTNAPFDGGTYVAQAGFAENEIAAASYILTPDQFPVKVELMEMIFATMDAIETTTTAWSIIIWDGPPTSPPAYIFSSDGEILPHIILPPGTNGINVQVSVDPNDPEQIILTNDGGTNTISFGFRIDEHNFQIQDPCFVPPPSNRNCFPTTDNTGLQSGSGNWLRGLNCGPFGCPPNGGWASFNQLSAGCRPTGDWVMRMTWTSLNCSGGTGACCMPDGNCVETDAANCAAAGGAYQGDGTDCATIECPEETQACCFESTGGCLDLTPGDCLAAGGVSGGAGTQCSTFVCFPTGAACMPDGTCIDDVTPDEAAALGATYMGDGTVCNGIECPDPVGAACFPNGFCLVLTEADAIQAGATWMGPGTTCADDDANGTADACEACDADVNDDDTVDSRDVIAFLNLWAARDPDADFDDNGAIDSRDVIVFLNEWNAGC
jgi:hypothetical protein